MKIILGWTVQSSYKTDLHATLLPTGLVSLEGVLAAAGHAPSLASFARFGGGPTRALLEDMRPGMVALSMFTFNRRAVVKLAGIVKKTLPETIVVVGGPHATPLGEHILDQHPEIDYVVLGEGERVLPALASALEAGKPVDGIAGLVRRTVKGIEATEPGPPIRSLDKLPPPALPLKGLGFDVQLQLRHMVTTRGCPGRCSFCQSPTLWPGAVRLASAETVVERMAALRATYGMHYFSIRDDTFSIDGGRLKDFARLVASEKLHPLWDCQGRVDLLDEEKMLSMRRAGCVQLQIGIESGSGAVLEALGKGIDLSRAREIAALSRHFGFFLSVYLITGVPGETDEDLAATRALLEELRPHSVVVARLALYPGTRLAAQMGGDSLWVNDPKETSVYVRKDEWSLRAEGRLKRWGARVGKRSAFTLHERKAQFELLEDVPVAHLAWGDALEEEERDKRATRVYRQMAERWPENAWAPYYLGEAHARANRMKKAVEAFARACQILPNSASCHQALGEAMIDAGDPEGGRHVLARALQLNPAMG